jgi:hypothetical protein
VSAWHDWRGGDCPTHPDAEVAVQFANGHQSRQDYRAGNLRWSRSGHPFDIAAYKVVSVEKVA